MSIFNQIGKATAKLNGITNKVGGAIIKGVSKVKSVEAVGPNALVAVSNTIKTAVNMAGNVERQIKETYLGRKALEGIDKLSQNIVGGVINSSNMHLFQDADLMKGLVNLNSPILSGSVGAFADVSNMYANLDTTTDSVYQPTQTPQIQSDSVWDYPSAGAELANVSGNNLTPKYKFQFIVDIQLAPELINGTTSAAQDSFTFLATEIDRPTFKYTTEELNSYNFRFTLQKKMTFDPVSVTLLDDNANNAMRLMLSIVRSTSPILNRGTTVVNIEDTAGLTFTDQSTYYEKTNNAYAASIGPVQGADMWMGQISDTTTPISSVTIYHLYDKSGFVNKYQYINPKITELDMDKLSMSDANNQVNEIKFSFMYDWVDITDSSTAATYKQQIERTSSRAKLVADTAVPTSPAPSVSKSYQNINPQVNQLSITPQVDLQSILPTVSSGINLSNTMPSNIEFTPIDTGSGPLSGDSLSDWLNNLEE